MNSVLFVTVFGSMLIMVIIYLFCFKAFVMDHGIKYCMYLHQNINSFFFGIDWFQTYSFRDELVVLGSWCAERWVFVVSYSLPVSSSNLCDLFHGQLYVFLILKIIRQSLKTITTSARKGSTVVFYSNCHQSSYPPYCTWAALLEGASGLLLVTYGCSESERRVQILIIFLIRIN